MPKRDRLPEPPRIFKSSEEDSGSEAEEHGPHGKRARRPVAVAAPAGSGGGRTAGDEASDSQSDPSEEEYSSSDALSNDDDVSRSDLSSGSEGSGAEQELTLGQLAAARQDGSTTPAAMKARARAAKAAAKAIGAAGEGGEGGGKHRGKHAPAEMSSRRPVPVLRDSVQAPRR